VSAWTDADIERLRKLHAEQCSAGIIGKLMHRSRNSIIGKLMRLNLHSTTAVRVVSRTRGPARSPGRPVIIAAKDGVFKAPVRSRETVSVAVPEPVLAPDASTNIPFLKVRGGQCKYMVSGHGPPFICCGAKTGDVRNPWCEFHRWIVFAPAAAYRYFRFFGGGRRS
jgi:hypothetical protein